MFARLASFAMAACALSASESYGQVYYGGYNLGPDYGAMLNEAVARQNQIVRQAEQRANEAVEKAMNDPRCKAMHQQHLAQGNRTSLRDFAYWYVATAGGTAEGKRRYMNNEADINNKEQAARQAYWQAQQKSREAIAQWQEGYRRNQQELGNHLMGNQTYTDPTGTRHVLPYTQPGTYQNPQTGAVYHLDQYGRYFMRDVNGYWTELSR